MVNGENAGLSELPWLWSLAHSKFCMSKAPICGEEKRRNLLKTVETLTVKCPMGHKNPAMCPLHEVRSRRRPVREQWLEKLADEDLRFIAEYHRICMEWQKAGCP